MITVTTTTFHLVKPKPLARSVVSTTSLKILTTP